MQIYTANVYFLYAFVYVYRYRKISSAYCTYHYPTHLIRLIRPPEQGLSGVHLNQNIYIYIYVLVRVEGRGIDISKYEYSHIKMHPTLDMSNSDHYDRIYIQMYDYICKSFFIYVDGYKYMNKRICTHIQKKKMYINIDIPNTHPNDHMSIFWSYASPRRISGDR